MEKFVAELMGALDGGLLSRRQFCERVALATTVYAAGVAETSLEAVLVPTALIAVTVK